MRVPCPTPTTTIIGEQDRLNPFCDQVDPTPEQLENVRAIIRIVMEDAMKLGVAPTERDMAIMFAIVHRRATRNLLNAVIEMFGGQCATDALPRHHILDMLNELKRELKV